MVGAQGVAKLLEKMVPGSQNGSSSVLQASKHPPECRWEPGPAPAPWPDSTCLWFSYSCLNLFIPMGKLIKVIVKALARRWEERGSTREISALAALSMLQLPQAELPPSQGYPCRDCVSVLTHVLPLSCVG